MPKPIEFVDFDEVLESRKDTRRDDMIFCAVAAPASMNEQERSARFVMSNESVDSYGDIVLQDGINLERFTKNPIAFFGHRSWDFPIGTWDDLRVVKSSPKRTEGTLKFPDEGMDQTADRTFRHVKAGTLKACSIGFRGKKVERIRDDEDRWTGGFKFHEIELYECSVVSVPAVVDALVKGATDETPIVNPEVIEEFLEHLKANPALAKMINRDLYEEVYREATGNKRSLTTQPPTEIIEIDGSSETSLSFKGLDEFRGLVERMERAAGIEPPVDADEEAADEFEAELEKAFDDFAPTVEAIEEEHRAGFLERVFKGFRERFGDSEEENSGPDPDAIAASKKEFREINEILKAV